MKTKILKLMLVVFIISLVAGCIAKNENSVIVQDNTAYNDPKEIRFITVGDPHVKSHNIDTGGNLRLAQIVDRVNKLDIDFVVFLGDITDDGKVQTFEITKKILKNMTKSYYVVIGNHDIFNDPKIFSSYFGSTEHIENIKGYQLIFVGIKNQTGEDGKIKLYWSFNFSKADKSAPTLVFLHGPVRGPPSECPSCKWEEFFGYARSMQTEIDNFPNLIGVYSGHVHYTSDQTFNGVRYITIDGLIKTNAGGISAIPSDEIGYSIIKDGKLEYKLINYK